MKTKTRPDSPVFSKAVRTFFLSVCSILFTAALNAETSSAPEPITEIAPAASFLAPQLLDPSPAQKTLADTAGSLSGPAEPPNEPVPLSARSEESSPQKETAPSESESPESTAGFELESSEPEKIFKNAAQEVPHPRTEETVPADVQRSIDELKEQIESLQAQIEKKQDIPDTSKKFSAKAGGLLNWDCVNIDQSRENQDLYGDIDNDFAARDLRVWVKGEGYGNLSYEVALGYAGRLSFKNVMLIAEDLPVLGTARIGYFKVESGLNYAGNVYNNTFVDWDSCGRSFQVGRRLGLGSIHYSEDKSVRFFTGVYTGQNLSIGDGKNANENNDNVGIILNTRLTAVPVYTETAGGELLEVLHVGAGFRWVDPGHDSQTGNNRSTALKAAPAAWLSDMTPLLSGSIDTNSYTVTNMEAAWQRGRFGLIGEGHIGIYNGYDNAYGVSTTGRFLLTPGAYQKYNKNGGCFGGIEIPENMRFVDYENWTCLEGGGVWEIAAQWAWTDFDMLRDAPAPLFYGRMNQYSFALNWYWNPQTRWGLNWIRAEPESGCGGGEETETAINTLACQFRFTF